MAASLVFSGCSDEPSSPPSMSLTFVVEPGSTPVNAAINPAPVVEVRDPSGRTDPTAAVAVTISLEGGTGETSLTGSTVDTSAAGVAVFSDLRVDRDGTYWLVASAPDAGEATSTTFRAFPPYVGITAGGDHSCAAVAGGVALCWGRNVVGQVGNGTMPTYWITPQVVETQGIGFAAVSAGLNHTCALTTSGMPYCWGENLSHQVGDGTTEDKDTPAPVSAPAGVAFEQLDAGAQHTCAVTFAGAAYCWGLNVEGAVGDGTKMNAVTPVAVAAPEGVRLETVSAGFVHTCAATPTGAAYCWGGNQYGALGDGTTRTRTRPGRVAAPAEGGFVAVSAGSDFSCGVTAAGVAYCWGRNDEGQVGDGTTAHRSTPAPVAAPAGVEFVVIDAGVWSTCAVARSGAAYCWGVNDDGQLGDGTTTGRTSPTLVAAPVGIAFATIDVGLRHTCALSVTGAAYCWGSNGQGRVGDGSVVDRYIPVPVER